MTGRYPKPSGPIDRVFKIVEPAGNDPAPQDFQSRAITLSAIAPIYYLILVAVIGIEPMTLSL